MPNEDSENDKIEAAFYAAMESNFTEEELDSIGMEDDSVTVSFTDGSAMQFMGVDSTRLIANLSRIGFAQMVDGTGARVTIFAYTITSIIAEGKKA